MSTENEKAVLKPAYSAVEFYNKASNLNQAKAMLMGKHGELTEVEAVAMISAIDAYVDMQAALQSQVSNTDGWVMVNVATLKDHLADLDRTADVFEAHSMFAVAEETRKAVAELEAMLAAAPKAPQQVSNTPQDDPLSGWLVTEISAIDCEYRGDPSYTHDAYWMREEVIGFIEKHKSVIDVTPPQQQEQSVEAVDAYNLHCETCNGHGFVVHSVRHGESDFEDFEQECPVCDGAGKAPKHVQDLQARYQEVRSELHALNMKIGMESLLGPSPTTPTITASQESAPGQEAAAYILRNEYDEYRLEPLEGFNIKQFPVEQEIKLYPAPPTSTAIAAMVIQKAAEICNKRGIAEKDLSEASLTAFNLEEQIKELLPANAEAELEALMMKVAKQYHNKFGYVWASEEDRRAIVHRVLDEMKGE
jgi:hypothetical protein